MKNLVVLTGAGISAESGLRTFRDMGGLWEQYDVMEVCSPQGWDRNPELVLDFYNMRRKQLLDAKPNNAHYGLADLQRFFNVHIITQNVDNLHEMAGSKDVLHLHGELMKVRSTGDESLIYDLNPANYETHMGDSCEKGFQLRPHIVFFGEAVPAIEDAIPICEKADIFVVIGTSMNVYPAAGLIHYAPKDIPLFLMDPDPAGLLYKTEVIKSKAAAGIDILKQKLMQHV
ncbi:NAD-dependent deacetylase [Saccharicrinis sp. FJH54]|uniref:SIR2 family NAD-dependent protein deacylase n=1 Tax=Saccharicrinis sp. FJH54 TaxID=3344665 RepID=UPI0035D4CF8B